MAFVATHRSMSAKQGKTILFVQISDVVHQPVVGAVAAGAIVADGILVYIRVAGITVGLGFFKNEAGMAVPAIKHCMLAGEGKVRAIVMKIAGVERKAQSRGVADGICPGIQLLPM